MKKNFTYGLIRRGWLPQPFTLPKTGIRTGVESREGLYTKYTHRPSLDREDDCEVIPAFDTTISKGLENR